MLTAKQKELLLFIHSRIKEDGVSPSFDEMKDALNLASKSGSNFNLVEPPLPPSPTRLSPSNPPGLTSLGFVGLVGLWLLSGRECGVLLQLCA